MFRILSQVSVFLIIFIIFFLLIPGCVLDRTPHSFTSYFTYELGIQSSDQITNATFYIPLPVKNGKPVVGMLVLNNQNFERNNFSVDLIQVPPGLNLTGSYPVQSNNQWFLKINADQIYPNNIRNAPIYKIFIDNLTHPHTPLSFVDTVYPITNESVFLPKIDFSPSIPAIIDQPASHWIRYIPIKVTQGIPVYADYSASSSTKVEIFSSTHGGNSWRYYDDSGGGNDYWDYFKWSRVGESHGWQIASGIYSAAEGVYPNLNHPEWQDVLKRTPINQ